MSWRQFLKSDTGVLRVKRVLSPPATPHKTLKTLKTSSIQNEKVPVTRLPEWQHNLCAAHAELNNWRGCCPCSIGTCLVSRVIDSDGDIDKLRGLGLGNGITTDMVIDAWRESGEPIADLLKSPAWMICIAEYLFTEKEAANEERKK